MDRGQWPLYSRGVRWTGKALNKLSLWKSEYHIVMTGSTAPRWQIDFRQYSWIVKRPPLLSVRALPVPPPPPSVSPRFSQLCLICVSPAFLFPSPTPLLASPSLLPWSELLHSAQTLLLHRSLSLALSCKDLVDKGAGVKRFPVSRRLADPRTVQWCRVSGEGEMRGTQCQARSSSSSDRHNHNTHRHTQRHTLVCWWQHVWLKTVLFTASVLVCQSVEHQCNSGQWWLDLIRHLYLIQHLQTGLQLCQLYTMSQN